MLSSSSIWKHWKLVSANGVMRAPFLLEGLDEVIILKILGLDLPRRARNDLLGGSIHPSRPTSYSR